MNKNIGKVQLRCKSCNDTVEIGVGRDAIKNETKESNRDIDVESITQSLIDQGNFESKDRIEFELNERIKNSDNNVYCWNCYDYWGFEIISIER